MNNINESLILPSQFAKSFSAIDLKGQFICCRASAHLPNQWPSTSTEGWHIAHHPTLPMISILDRESRLLGYFFGYPISPNGQLESNSIHFKVSAGDADCAAKFEQALYEFGGRYAAIFLGKGVARMYLDPYGSLSAVYCTQLGIIASSPMLIPYEASTGDDEDLIRAIGIPHITTSYPLGLTPRNGVQRLLPNHYLDLSIGEMVRHWPNKEIEISTDTDTTVGEIAYCIERNLKAVARDHPLHLSLTAGLDSRVVLACARDVLDEAVFFTLNLPDDTAQTDCEIAQELAYRHGLKHKLYSAEPASRTEYDLWLYRTGLSAQAYRGWRALRAFSKLDSDRVYLPAFAAELSRGFFWHDADREDTMISGSELLKRINPLITQNSIAYKKLLDAVNRWLSGAPSAHAFQILDFAYIENQLGTWTGVMPYSQVDAGAFTVFPLCHRRTVELMMSLPAQYRKESRFARDIISRKWPELLNLPFNKPVVTVARADRMRIWARRQIAKWHYLAAAPFGLY